MTLAALLKELKGIDPDTADDIGDIVNVISIMSDGSFSSDAYYPDFIIQGCIQRACERREWEGTLLWRKGTSRAMILEFAGGFGATERLSEREENSPAEALLAAYIAAVKEEK